MADKTAPSKNFLIASVLGLGIVSAVAGYFYLDVQEDLRRPAPEKLVTFEGFPEGTKIKSEFSGGLTTHDLVVEDGVINLTDKMKENYSFPYQINASFQTPQDEYFDFAWSIAKSGVQYNIIADGFSPDDRVTLVWEGNKVYTIPFDWSGKIELPMTFPNDLDNTACIQIEHKQDKFSLCNFVPGRKKA